MFFWTVLFFGEPKSSLVYILGSDILDLSFIIEYQFISLTYVINIKYIINKNFKDISAQIYSTFDDSSKFYCPYESLRFEKSTNIEKYFGENVFKLFINAIIYVYYVSLGNELILWYVVVIK